MNVKRLTILQGQVRADVQVGVNQWGGAVCVQVSLPRKADEVQQAMATLENLMLRTAQEHIRDSGIREGISAGVAEQVEKALKTERERIAANATETSHREIAALNRRLDDKDRQSLRAREQVYRDIEVAFYGVEFPGIDKTQVMPVITEVLRSKRNGEK